MTTKRSSLERRWSAAKHEQGETGLFDTMNLRIALADANTAAAEATATANSATSTPFASVPVIDISSFVVPNSTSTNKLEETQTQAQAQAQAHCVDAVVTACQHLGFFKIIGHGIDPTIIEKVLHASAHFFADQAMATKVLASDPNNAMHGYYATENIHAALGRDGAADRREGYAIGPSTNCDFYHNYWPPSPEPTPTATTSELEDTATRYYDAMEHLEQILHVILTRALKHLTEQAALPDTWLQQAVGRHRGLLRLNYYPPAVTAAPGNFGAHSDWSTFTILYPTGPGLEVIQQEEWRQVDYPPATDPSTFVINIGDILERWSNGEFTSSIHRVQCCGVPNTTTTTTATTAAPAARQSLAYFCAEIVDPSDTTIVQPLLKPQARRVFDEDLSIVEYMTRNFEGMTGKKV